MTGSVRSRRLVGSRIAVELRVDDRPRIVHGVVIEEPQSGGQGQLRIALDDPDGREGGPILIVQDEYLLDVQRDSRFGCEYFLRLAKE